MSLFDRLIAETLPFVPRPLVRHFSAPYIAGETLQDAVDSVKKLNSEGAMATIDVLGEAVSRMEEADKAADSYLPVIEAIVREELDANISIKPTMLGLALDYDACKSNFTRVIEKLRPHDMMLRIDMEDSPYTSLTLDLVNELRGDYSNIGLVLQSYMRRSMDDLKTHVIPNQTNIRLCKGIYVEPSQIAYQDFDVVRRNYSHLLRTALSNGVYVGIATHDEVLTWEAVQIIGELGLSPDQYEFQMLLGVTPELRRQLIRDGHRMRVYVPFGKDWYAYASRRLKENPKIAGYVLKDILKFRR
ncbi:MAG TPA: proline dehydrogenase [Bacteroidetes bacterium]|nr:proline dehydrogenase 1 [bacterium BMS3Bbin04]HDO64620.1 proline dehydrogenase [Bacteroidota bacterium]HEX03745.1 proline dehydrogenase [Bacteroidota bacterium]